MYTEGSLKNIKKDKIQSQCAFKALRQTEKVLIDSLFLN